MIQRKLVWLFALPLLAQAAPGERVPLETFANPASTYAADISPDGKHIVLMARSGGRSGVAMMNVDTGQVSALLQKDADLYQLQSCWFKTDTRLLCDYVPGTRTPGGPSPLRQLVALNIDGTELQPLAPKVSEWLPQDIVIDRLRDDPRHVLIQGLEAKEFYPSVLRLDVHTGERVRVLRARAPVIRWLTDRSGVVRFGYGFAGKMPFYQARDSDTAPWRILHRTDGLETKDFTAHSFGADQSKMIVSAPRGDFIAAWEIDLTDQNDRQLLFAAPGVDLSGFVYWPSDGRLVGFEYVTDKPQQELFDDLARTIRVTLDNLLPGAVNKVVGASSDNQRLVVSTYSNRKPLQYMLLDLKAKTLAPLPGNKTALQAEQLATTQSVTFPATDGTALGAYLTLPTGSDGKNLPAIIFASYGRYGRPDWGFNPLVQMLANRGYAVLQVNPRGTGGKGFEWLQSGWRHGGKLMAADVNASAAWLIKSGTANPKRLCLVGFDFGAYAALGAAVDAPALYRCAVSVGGVMQLKELDWGRRFIYYGDQVVINSLDENGVDRSPLENASKLKLPLLLLHGTADAHSNLDQSKWMARALERQSSPVKFVQIEGGDHFFELPQARLRLMQEMEAFLGEQLAER